MAADLSHLQEKLTFQEHTLQTLDEALASQQRQIMLLEQQVKLLNDQLRKLEDAMADNRNDQEKPPHY